MSRVKLPKGRQKAFLNHIGDYFNFNWQEIAQAVNVSTRTLRDWRSEKYHMNHAAVIRLCKISGISVPQSLNILPEYWSARKYCRLGAQKRYEIHGELGTFEGRRKGGIRAQRLFRENPQLAKECGVNIRKQIVRPAFSKSLAEFIGIMLGDGGMSDYQITVTVNRETDKDYAVYIRALIKRLFLVRTAILMRKDDAAVRIVASSKNLIEFLQNCGLKTGNKVKNKIDIARWIFKKREYKISCIRGLFDTDGCCYSYNHRVHNKNYHNLALCFTNYFQPLLRSVYGILKEEGYNPVLSKNRIYIHKKKYIAAYFKKIGSHNSKHLRKYQSFIDSKVLLAK